MATARRNSSEPARRAWLSAALSAPFAREIGVGGFAFLAAVILSLAIGLFAVEMQPPSDDKPSEDSDWLSWAIWASSDTWLSAHTRSAASTLPWPLHRGQTETPRLERAADRFPSGHLGGAVNSVAFSPDGTRIVSGGSDGTVRLWTLEGKPAAEPFKGHEGWVLSVAFSPDGTRIVSGGADGTVRLWTLEGKPAAEPLKGHEGLVNSVAFSPDGTRIVSGGADGKVRLWTLDGKPAAEPFKGHEGAVFSVAFSPDGTRIVSGGSDGTVRLWTLDGKPAAEPFKGHEGWVLSVAFSPDGARIVSGGFDGTVRLWTLEGKPAAEPFKGHEGGVNSVAFSPDGTRIVSGGDDGTVWLWTLDGKPAAEPFKGHERWVLSVASSPDGTRIVSGGFDGTVRLWTLDGKPAAEPFKGHERWVLSVAFSPDGTRIVSGGFDGTVRLWTLDGKPAAEPFKGHEGGVNSVAFSPDGTRIVSGGFDGTVRLWTLYGNSLGLFRDRGFAVFGLATDSTDRIVVGDSGGRIAILRIAVTHVTPPLWSFAALIAGLGGLAFWTQAARATVKRLQLGASPGTEVQPVAYFLQADSPIDDPAHAGDAMRSLTERLSRFLRNRNTSAPMTFALTGDWGTGKSSVMSLVQRDLREHRYPSIWFNAWHHQNEEHLFAALMEAIRQRAAPPLLSFRNVTFRLRLASLRFNAAPVANTLRLFVVVLALAIVGRLLAAHEVWQPGEKLEESLQHALSSSAFLLAAAGLLWTITGNLFKPFGVSPASLVSTSAGWFRLGRFEERLDFRQRFGRAFGDVCEAFGDRRLVLIIDDLDRCKAEFVPEVLEAINFLTSSGRCFVLLGISTDPVHAAVGLAFRDIAEELAKQGNKANGHKARFEFANAYLEKLINLQIEIPRFDSKALREWMAQAANQIELVSDRRYGLGRLFLGAAVALGFGLLAALAIWHASLPSGSPAAQADEGAASSVGRPAEVSATPADTSAGGVAVIGPTPPAIKGREGPLAESGAPEDNLLQQKGPTPAEQSGVALGTWLPLFALSSLFAMALAFTDKRFRRVLRPLEDPDVLDDSAEFQRAFATWAPLVLARHDSPRAVKRFANRMRYLAAGLEGETLASSALPLMTIGALHEVAEIDRAVPYANWKRRTKWRETAAADLKLMGSPAAVNELAAQVTQEQWDLYWSLASSVRFAGTGPSEEASEAT